MANATGGFESSRYTYINSLLSQVKGSAALGNLDTGKQVTNFVGSIYGVGDPLNTRLSQLVGRTLMAVRPYEDRLRGIEVTNEEFGWITRKENFVDDDVMQNQTFALTDGSSIDQYIVQKPKVVETQTYGGGQISRGKTIYRKQIQGAFTSASALDEFISGVLMHFNSQIAQDREQYKRTALLNYMGCLSTYPTRVVHLVSEYNTATGSSLTSTTVFAPANFEGFVQWLYGYIQKLVGLMSERSYQYHLNPTTASPVSGNIARQTAPRDLRAFFNTGFKADMTARVVANTFNRDDLKEVQYEAVNFWQSIQSPTSINVNVKPMTTALAEGSSTAASLTNVFGVLMDRDALAVSFMDNSTEPSPYNARGEFYTLWHNETVQVRQDLTENGILLLLDTAP